MTDMDIFPDSLFDFISRHAGEDAASLRLRFGHGEKDGFSIDFAIDQIEARRKASGRLSSLLSHGRFLFPALICAEQASSSAVAAFHATLVGKVDSVLDLTCGLGSDAMAIAANASELLAIERDEWYCRVLGHNLKECGFDNVTVCNDDCNSWLAANDRHFDIIFADPHRRDAANGRTYSFSDCTPDIAAMAPSLTSRCGRLIIKASPMLDISLAASEVAGCEEVYAVAERGECKELLIVAREGGEFRKVASVNITRDGVHEYSISADKLGRNETIAIASVEDMNAGFLYEPNAAAMKLQCGDAFSKDFPGIRRVGSNTSLYAAVEEYPSFPGRILRIEGIADRKELKKMKGKRFNVVSRNHPLKVRELAANLKVRPSENDFIYATSVGPGKGKPVIVRATLLKSN